MVDSTNTNTIPQWEYVQEKGYKLYQSGSHIKGNFIQAFVPDTPYRDNRGKLRLVVYLHGFALCLPKFYEDHLETLARQGYYVFFPDFQKSDYPDAVEGEQLYKVPEKSHLAFWVSLFYKLAVDTIFKRDQFRIEDFFGKQYEELKEVPTLQGKLKEPNRAKYLRVSLALVVIILIIKLMYSWFKRNYGKHLIKLISTVGLSLLHSPSEWMEDAIALTEQAWIKLSADNPDLKRQEFDFYVFGHSLGGLLALSWTAYVPANQPKFFPKQIITADPAPSNEMGIPQIAIWILKLFNSPFTAQPIEIRETGKKLNIPVAIMHGADDNIVKPEAWVKPSFLETQPNFDYIASQHKKIYFSLSNQQDRPPLIAFHNQAVTDTTYFDDALFDNFGGVKKGPNAYNQQYVWPGLNLVVEDRVRADELLDKFPLQTIQVTDKLPSRPSDFKVVAIAILAALALLVLGYAFWHSGSA